MKNNTNQTSSHHPNDIVFNISIRHQAKIKIDNFTIVERKKSYIHNIYKVIRNTQKKLIGSFEINWVLSLWIPKPFRKDIWLFAGSN